jgi:hypothetical protein
MLLSALMVLLQLPAGAPVGQPVRLTLEPSTVAPGDAVHVFVEVATAGHLIVLRLAADGRAEVVFPADPSSTFVARGVNQPPAGVSVLANGGRAASRARWRSSRSSSVSSWRRLGRAGAGQRHGVRRDGPIARCRAAHAGPRVLPL